MTCSGCAALNFGFMLHLHTYINTFFSCEGTFQYLASLEDIMQLKGYLKEFSPFPVSCPLIGRIEQGTRVFLQLLKN